jgi:hypothetical protein
VNAHRCQDSLHNRFEPGGAATAARRGNRNKKCSAGVQRRRAQRRAPSLRSGATPDRLIVIIGIR